MSIDEVRGQLQAYTQQLAEVKAELAAVKAGAASESGGAARVKVREIAHSAEAIAPLATLEDVPHYRESNPVVRPASAPATAALLDLVNERGHTAVSIKYPP